MTRFFFHVREGGDVSCDTEGQEFPDLEAARIEAMNASREIIGEKILHGGSINHRQIEISDERGDVLAVVNAQDTLFEDGQLRSFRDDVTKSAPVVRATGSKAADR
jgi:hypothetical protein